MAQQSRNTRSADSKSGSEQAGRDVKVLLLGCGQSGKSTTLKSLHLFLDNGFSAEDRRRWKGVIQTNILHMLQVISFAMEEAGLSFADTQTFDSHKAVLEKVVAQDDENIIANPNVVDAIESVWRDSFFQKFVSNGGQVCLHDSVNYFLPSVRRVTSAEYVPTSQDIMRARQRSTGISETLFEEEPDFYRVYDCAGFRSERKKWIHAFENVDVLLFHAPADAYAHVLVEDRRGNTLYESLGLFEAIANSRWFERSLIVLLFTKCDTLPTTLKTLPPNQSVVGETELGLSDYDGGANVNVFLKYLTDRFLKLVRDPEKARGIEVRYTSITEDITSPAREVTDIIKRHFDPIPMRRKSSNTQEHDVAMPASSTLSHFLPRSWRSIAKYASKGTQKAA